MSEKESTNPTTHFIVYGSIFDETTGAVKGIRLYRMDDWEAFKVSTETEQAERFTHLRTDNFGKVSKKNLGGNPGTVYRMEYKESETEEGQYTIWPGSAEYVTRLNTEYTRRWDERDRNEVSAAKSRNMTRKNEKLRLRDDMTFGEIRKLYSLLTPQKKAVLMQSLIQEMIKTR